MQIGIYPDINSLSHEAAQIIVRLANEATVTRGRFSIALSGGSTPKVLYGLLATEPYLDQINWSSVEIFWSDERCVPPDDAESNYAMAKEVLLSKIPIQPRQIHRMPAEKADAVQAVLEGSYQPDEYPAQIVRPTNGEVTWMLDTAAAGKLTQK